MSLGLKEIITTSRHNPNHNMIYENRKKTLVIQNMTTYRYLSLIILLNCSNKYVYLFSGALYNRGKLKKCFEQNQVGVVQEWNMRVKGSRPPTAAGAGRENGVKSLF